MQAVEQHSGERSDSSSNFWHVAAFVTLGAGLDLSETDPAELEKLRGLRRFTFLPGRIATEYRRRLRLASQATKGSFEQAVQRVNRHDPQKQLYEDTTRYKVYRAVGNTVSVLASVADLSFLSPDRATNILPRRNEDIPVRIKVWGGTFLGNIIRCRTEMESNPMGLPLPDPVPSNDPPRHIDDVLETHVQQAPLPPTPMMVSELGFFRGAGLQSGRPYNLM